MFDIEKKPIIIISTPRTGSTALCKIIYNKYKHLPNFKEYMEPLLPSESFENFFTDVITNKNKNFVLKVQAGEIKNLPDELDEILCYNHCTTIFLRRKDLIAQYTSNYIAKIRNYYIYKTKIVFPDKKLMRELNSNIPANINLMCEAIIDIDYHLNKMNNLIYKKNVEVYYEDLDLDQQDFYMKTIDCLNYDQLYNKIKDLNNKKNTPWFLNLTKSVTKNKFKNNSI